MNGTHKATPLPPMGWRGKKSYDLRAVIQNRDTHPDSLFLGRRFQDNLPLFCGMDRGEDGSLRWRI